MEGPEQSYAVIGQANQANELQVISQYANCGWLKVTTPSQLTGWLLNDSSAISLLKACEAIPAGTFRPVTGVIKAFGSVGEGELTIDNGLSNDAVIILSYASSPAESLTAAFVRSGEKYVLSGIPDGEYIVFFAVGSEWNGKEFTEDKRVERFEETFNFVTSSTEYTIWDITLHPIPGGTGTTEEVPPEDFPSIN